MAPPAGLEPGARGFLKEPADSDAVLSEAYL